MSGFALPLELKILSINVLGLVDSTLNWSWLKWDRQLEKISNFSVSQSDELVFVEDIDWLRTILSWIVVARFVINRVFLLAYVVNIYTIVTRSRQNLLVLWMVLSFLKDIVLEIIVIAITFLLWRKGSAYSTSLLVKFVAEKTVCLVVSICKWCTTFKWYVQLRRIAKIRRFTIIARRSIANIINIPGRVGHSLDDESLGIAIIRRGKYASLLNTVCLHRLSEELSSKTKSLMTLATEDTNDTNDYNSDVNDLSVAEKSMRMLNVTAEDVMDARARILERSYWDEQESVKIPEVIEDVVAQFPLNKNNGEIIDASRNKQVTKDEKTVNHALRKEDIMAHLFVKEEEKKDNEIIPVDREEQTSTRNQEDILLVKSNDVVSDEVDNHAKSTESLDTYVTSKKKRREEEKGVAKIVQCPSFQNARNMEAKPCASLVKKLEAKFCTINFCPVNQMEKGIDQAERRRHPCQINTQLTPTASGTSRKECYKNSKICACHRALRNSSKNGKHARSIDGKNVKYDIDEKELRLSIPIINMQRSKLDKSAFKYSDAYRLKKQIQRWKELDRKQSWGSRSLAQTAHPSGYAKTVSDASDKLPIVNCQRNIQTEIRDESMTMSESLYERYRLKHKQMRNRRAIDLRSVYNMASFTEKNYTYEVKMKALEICNNFTLKTKGETKARKRYDLLPANHKLSIEERETMELRDLKAYNELTLSEDKEELEVKRKEHDSSLNYEQLMKESEVPGMRVLKTYNEPTLPEDKKEIERTRGREHNSSPSSRQSVDERSASRVRNKLTRSRNEREPDTERKRDLPRDETPECEEDVETPTSISNHLSIGSYYENTITTPMHTNSGLSDRYARQVHVSLNLREITRNIECTVHPRGVTLANKNLHGQFMENERPRESQQRDIVDDNTASTLHSALFFKPEIITRLFRRAQTGIDEFFPSFPTSFRRENSSTEFVCRVNNEIVVRNWDSSFNFERMVGEDRNTLEDPVLLNASGNRGTGSERGHDLCIIFIGQEQIPSESETIVENSMTGGSQVSTRSNIESTQMTRILIFDEDCNRPDSAINDNLPVRLTTDALRNFDIEISEEDVAPPNEEYQEYVSNVNVYNNPQSWESNAADINLNEENNNEGDKISSHNNADVSDTIHEIEQTLNSSDNYQDMNNVISNVRSLEKLNNLRDEKYLSTTDIYSENKICKNNLAFKSTNNTTLQLPDNNNNNNNKQFDKLDNKTEKNMFNQIFKNSSKLSFPSPSSFIESNNCHASRSCNEELQELTEFSNSATMFNDQRKESISKLKSTNYDTISQFRKIETLKLETTVQDGAKNKNREICEETNKFLTEKIFKMHSDDNLRQDDSFYFTYKRNDDPGTPVSLEDGSLMEEFLNDPIPFNSLYS